MFLFTMLAACLQADPMVGADDAEAARVGWAGLDRPLLESRHTIVGLPMTFHVSSVAPPGTRIRVYVGRDHYALPRPCDPGVPDACLMIRDALLVGEAALDANGDAVVTFDAPPALEPGVEFLTQALARGPRGFVRASDVVAEVALDPNLDEDVDGLSNQEEWLWGTNLRRADTDGGGELDAQEVFAGRDPSTGRDDVAEEWACDNGVDDDQDGLDDCADADCGGCPVSP